MAPPTMKKVRSIRSKGKKMLGGINDRLNILAWELASQNQNIGDPNVTRAVNTMDEALENLQVAFALLNTISVDPAMFEEKAPPRKRQRLHASMASAKKSSGGFLNANNRLIPASRRPERVAVDLSSQIFKAPQIGVCRILRLLRFDFDGRHITRPGNGLTGFGFTETGELCGLRKAATLSARLIALLT